MSWGEALRATDVLVQDSASHVGAALAGLKWPVTFEAQVLMGIYNTLIKSPWFKSAKPWPSPFPERTKRRTAPAPDITQAEIIAALRRAGHHGPLPAGVDEAA